MGGFGNGHLLIRFKMSRLSLGLPTNIPIYFIIFSVLGMISKKDFFPIIIQVLGSNDLGDCHALYI